MNTRLDQSHQNQQLGNLASEVNGMSMQIFKDVQLATFMHVASLQKQCLTDRSTS